MTGCCSQKILLATPEVVAEVMDAVTVLPEALAGQRKRQV
jgi:hypothetical protein